MVDPREPTQTACSKQQHYRGLEAQIGSVVAGESDAVARMACVACLLKDLADVSWCGFYRVDPNNPAELVIGPYQGPLGCLRIAFGRGVCGTAAERRETVVVEDVHAFPGHIACDSSALSEIVVPVFDARRELIAVLDLDSRQRATFDADDAEHLRRILDLVFSRP